MHLEAVVEHAVDRQTARRPGNRCSQRQIVLALEREAAPLHAGVEVGHVVLDAVRRATSGASAPGVKMIVPFERRICVLSMSSRAGLRLAILGAEGEVDADAGREVLVVLVVAEALRGPNSPVVGIHQSAAETVVKSASVCAGVDAERAQVVGEHGVVAEAVVLP